MQALNLPPAVLPTYDDVELQRELDVCPDWFFACALSLTLSDTDKAIFKQFSACLLGGAEQPRVRAP